MRYIAVSASAYLIAAVTDILLTIHYVGNLSIYSEGNPMLARIISKGIVWLWPILEILVFAIMYSFALILVMAGQPGFYRRLLSLSLSVCLPIVRSMPIVHNIILHYTRFESPLAKLMFNLYSLFR